MSKTVIEMVVQCGFWREHIDTWLCSTKDFERFAELVRADERAKLAEQPAQPASEADMQVYKAIADNYHASLQPAPVQEPVAWQDKAKPSELVAAEEWDNIDPQWRWMYRPLYTTPQAQRKPLTPNVEADTGYSRAQRAAFKEGWEEAEAAHGITKGNT